MKTIIVSGHPRSGTSAMMQCLHAGGYPVFADINKSDEDNPRGYFEVPNLDVDMAGFLARCEGKATKVTSFGIHLLPPRTLDFHIIWMHRNLEAVVDSFRKLNEKRGLKIPTIESVSKIAKMSKDVAKRLSVKFIEVDYDSLIIDPRHILEEIKSKWDLSLNIDAAASVVDGSLNHHKIVEV